jgi:hypothetical protein
MNLISALKILPSLQSLELSIMWYNKKKSDTDSHYVAHADLS